MTPCLLVAALERKNASHAGFFMSQLVPRASATFYNSIFVLLLVEQRT